MPRKTWKLVLYLNLNARKILIIRLNFISWFISSLTAVSNLEICLNMILPEDNLSYEDENYCGIFHFRFWRFGFWMDVCIDDRLPVDENDKLIFCHNRNDPNDVLGSLIEKAYAKLVTCYEFINSGESIDALIDLTGSIYYEQAKLNKLRMLCDFYRKKNHLWTLLLDSYFNKSALVVANIKNCKNNESSNKIESLNLMHGHSYTVVQVIEIFSKSNIRQYFKKDDENFSSNSIKLIKYFIYENFLEIKLFKFYL